MPKDAATTSQDPARIWEMMIEIGTCMFVTSSDGSPRGRPMSTIPRPDERMIFLLTEATSGAAHDVSANGTVLLSFQGRSDHVALLGKAAIDPDTRTVAWLWSTGAQVFWPAGPEASNVVAIAVTPECADYWDGPNPAIGAVKFLFALASGKEPDMGERGAVRL
ncbi:MAG: pyridoxamine 5'-phosphate oxidase family protein [Paracoccaceae bacterium]